MISSDQELQLQVQICFQSVRKQPSILTEIKRSLVALDESQDLLVEIKAGVPDQGPIPEDPHHHLAVVSPADDNKLSAQEAIPPARKIMSTSPPYQNPQNSSKKKQRGDVT